MNNELKHWGIKGMKWGVRRYQNKDGTLTEAGQRRYDKEVLRSNGKKKPKADPDKWVREDMERSRRLTGEASGLVGGLKNLNERAIKNTPRTRMDLSSMSDKELRERINRELLERQYNDVFNPAKVSRGREHVQNILDTTGSVLAITGSAIGVALAIKELKG